MSISEAKKMLTLKSFDNEAFEVEESVAVQSRTIKNIVDDNCAPTGIPLPNVSSATLVKVIQYLKKHADPTVGEEDMKKFDDGFVKDLNVGSSDVFDLILAANYLDIPNLMDITCQKCSENIKDMSAKDVRALFNVENDYTPEEEEAVFKENAWAHEI